MWDNKKGQIGETMTWIVATLVIVVILSISILLTIPLGSEKKINIEDKGKDFLATVSITNFLSEDINVDLIKTNDKNRINSEMKLFLDNLIVNPPKKLLERTQSSSVVGKSGGGWNFEINEGDEKIQVITSKVYNKIGGEFLILSESEPNFELKLLLEQKKLRFWAECPGGKCK